VTAARAILPLALVAASLGCGNRERAPHDFERMRVQQRYEPYAPSGVFADGKAMQRPPAGTVAREAAVGATPAPDASPARLAEGEERFRIYCAVCHGATGFGGSIVAANMGPPRPPSLHSARVRALPADALFRVVSGGVGRMPGYAWQLTVPQRWAVVAYVQALRDSSAAGPVARADSLAAERLRAIDSAQAVRQAAQRAGQRAAPPPGATR